MNTQNKAHKGEYGYLTRQKKLSIVKTLISFSIAIAIFIIGYCLTKTKENIYSIIAVLLLLPASRNTVSMIMYLRTPAFQDEIYHELSDTISDISVLYHLYLTSYQKNFPITCFAVKGSNLIGFSEFSNCDIQACEEHVKEILQQNGVKNINIKIFGNKDLKMFEERLKQIQKLEPGKHDDEILSLMCDISL